MSENKNLIALLTDFGTRDYFVGAMKGAILRINQKARIVDITHDIAPQNIREAGFTLRACFRDFPEKTIFAAVVDPGVGSARSAILVETKQYFFVAPDNGLLSFVFDETKDVRVFEISNRRFLAEKISRTFHGRDIFAPVAAHLSKGVEPEEFGAEIKNFARFEENRPRRISSGKTEAEIIHIDRFGNLITNLTRADVPEKFALEIGGRRIEKLQDYFAESEPGRVFMIFGSARFLEIAAFQDSAEKLLGAETGQKISLISF